MVPILSSLIGDAWHDSQCPQAYERWHFDAVSDDGREAIVISFSDNYVFSPRYGAGMAAQNPTQGFENGDLPLPAGQLSRFPAVSFLYSVDGKAIFRSVIEYPRNSFVGNRQTAEGTIGDSSFRFESASYGSGFMLAVCAPLAGGRRLAANLEWLLIEADLLPDPIQDETSGHVWNLVSPRSDVTGRISISDKNNDLRSIHFRGTGYHDHILDERQMQTSIVSRQWGRAHFADSTAVFCRLEESGWENEQVDLVLIRDGNVHQRTARCDDQQFSRDKFGIKYPSRLSLVSEDNIRIRVKALKVIESSFYHVRLLSEMTLMLRDGKPRKTIGFTEYTVPERMKRRVIRWFADLWIGKDGKASVL